MRTRTALGEAATLAALTGVVAFAYWHTHAPLFNPPASIDPWLYTALFVNFHSIYHLFDATYYPSRLPWIIPGYILNSFLSPRSAYFALHTIFFLAAGLFLYLLVRSYLGRTPALIVYVTLLASQMWWDANRWDYWEGPITAYLAAGFFFGLTRRTGRLRLASLAAAGFFLAAAISTNLFSTAMAMGLPLMYAFVWWRGERRFLLRQVSLDSVAFTVGFLALLVGCGVFARVNGGPFWFLGPQITAAMTIKASVYKQPVHEWIGRESRLLVPLFLLAVGALLLATPPRGRARRFTSAVLAYLTYAVVFFVIWEFPLGGYFLEYTYYFSPLLTALMLCLGAFVFVVLTRGEGNRRVRAAAAVVLATAAAEIPLLRIYGSDAVNLVGSRGLRDTAILMGVAIIVMALTLLVRRSGLATWAALAAVFAIVFATSYGLDASYGVYTNGVRDPNSGPVFNLGMGLVRYLRRTIPTDPLPAFWYDKSNLEGGYVGIQSLYYFSYSYVGLDLPRVDADFRRRMTLFKPKHLVLLCPDESCSAAPRALARARYRVAPLSAKLLREGGRQMWVSVFRVDGFVR